MRNLILKTFLTFCIVFSISGSLVPAQDEIFNRLSQKIHEKDVNGVRILLKSGININIRNSNGLTPLMDAAKIKDNLAVVIFLVCQGADLNAEDNNGWTPLRWSIRGAMETSKYLLESGADPNVIDRFGETAFTAATIVAIKQKKMELLDLMLSHNADINRTFVSAKTTGNTALIHAASAGDVELIIYLLLNGANINHVNSEGNTPVMVAAEKRRIESLRLLVERGADLSIQNNSGETAFDIAKRLGATDILEMLE